MSSVNAADQSLVSGILVNTKTGESKSFDMSGVMDEAGAVSVMDSALGANSLKWDPVLPQPFIINGEFYWGSAIVANGIYQEYAMVKGIDQSEVFFGETVALAIEKINLGNTNSNLSLSTTGETVLVRKDVLERLLKKVAEIEELKAQLIVR